MDRMDIPAILIVSFPEAVLVAALGLALMGIRAGWLELVVIGGLQASVAYLVRLAPVPFGLHSLLLAVVFISILYAVMRLHWRIAAVAGLLGLTIYVAVETAVSPVLLYLTGYSLGARVRNTKIPEKSFHSRHDFWHRCRISTV